MPRTTIALANASGSAGKTTSAVSLAVIVAETGSDVLLIDLDPQANATSWLLNDRPDDLTVTVTDVLTRGVDANAAILDTEYAHLRLLPSNRGLDAAPAHLLSVIGRELKLRNALRSVQADVVIIDCPGSINILTINALTAADALVTVTQPSMKEVEGIPEMLDTVGDVRDAYNPSLEFGGIIPCIMPPANQGKVYTDVMALLEQYWPGQIAPAVRRAAVVATAYGRKTPLPVFAPDEAVTADYRAVLAWLQDRGVL